MFCSFIPQVLFPFYNSDAKGGPDQSEPTVNAQQRRWEDDVFYIKKKKNKQVICKEKH